MFNPAAEDRFDFSEDGVIVTNAEGTVRFINASAEGLVGVNIDLLRGQRLFDFLTIINETTRQTVADPVRKCLDTNAAVILGNHDVLVTRAGVEIPIAGSATPITSTHGGAIGCVFIVRDVTPTRLLLRRISYQASDEGRGRVCSRHQFLQRIEQLLGAMSDIHEHAIIMVKCKNHGDIEEGFGVEDGEMRSNQLMRLFAAELREDDVLAMLSEEDFGLLLTHCPRCQAQWIMRRIKKALHHYRSCRDQASVRLEFRVDVLFLCGKDYTGRDLFISDESLVYDEDGRLDARASVTVPTACEPYYSVSKE